MRNVEVSEEGSKLTITIDTSKDFGPSRSGKTIIIASTDGNQPITDSGIILGLNAYKRRS